MTFLCMIYYDTKGMINDMLKTYITFTYFIYNSLPPLLQRFLRPILGIYLNIIGYMILYVIYLFVMAKFQLRILYFLNEVGITFMFYLLYIFQILLYGFIVFLPSASLQRDERAEIYLKKFRKEMMHMKCDQCNLTYGMRSFHCIYCNQCIAKFQGHNHFFNKCIDARNSLSYWLYIVICFTINLLSIITSLYYIHIREKRMPRPFIYIVLLFIQFCTLGKELYTYSNLLFCNLTILEFKSWYLIPYMWNNEKRAYYNPFNRGLRNNIKQSLKSTFKCVNTILQNEEIELNTGKLH